METLATILAAAIFVFICGLVLYVALTS